MLIAKEHPHRAGGVMREDDCAADAIERLQTDLAKKDSQITEWKNAWRIANSLYKSAQAETDELRAYQHGLIERIESLKAEQNGEEKHE